MEENGRKKIPGFRITAQKNTQQQMCLLRMNSVLYGLKNFKQFLPRGKVLPQYWDELHSL